jgi:hypothetical protein
MIYATGGDGSLRRMCWSLLEAGLVSKADLVERTRIYLKNGEKRKVGSTGRGVVVFCERRNLDEVMTRMQQSYNGDDLAAYALPVLASI